MQIRHCGYLLAGFLMAPPGLAQNLVANSAFTTGVDGWTGSGFSWDASDGDPAPGSLRLTSSGTLVISGCMPIAGEQMVHVAMNARAFDSSHQAEAKADVFSFTDSSCASQGTLAGALNSSVQEEDVWFSLDHRFVLPNTTQSVHIELSATPGEGNTVVDAHFDNIQFGPVSDLIVRHPFQECWSPAYTADGFAALLNASTAGATGCIPGSADVCATSTCNSMPGCPITLRSGSVVYNGTSALVAGFDGTGGVEPLVMDMTSSGVTCTITVSQTSTLVANYQTFFAVTNDGNNGWYMGDSYGTQNVSVSGLSSSDWSADGADFACKFGNYFTTAQVANAIATGVQSTASQVASVALGSTICPLP